MPPTYTSARRPGLPPIPTVLPGTSPLPPDVAGVLSELHKAKAFEARERERRVGVTYAHSGLQILAAVLVFGLPSLFPNPGESRVGNLLFLLGPPLAWLAVFYTIRFGIRRRFGPRLTGWRSLFRLPWPYYVLLGLLFVGLYLGGLFIPPELASVHLRVFLVAVPLIIGLSYVLEGMHQRDGAHIGMGLLMLLGATALTLLPIPPLVAFVAGFVLTGIVLVGVGLLRYRRVPAEVPA